jgi:hypothetical protein
MNYNTQGQTGEFCWVIMGSGDKEHPFDKEHHGDKEHPFDKEHHGDKEHPSDKEHHGD